MGFRRFTDRDGRQWEIRPRTRDEWDLDPFGDNPERRRTVKAPGYERDPYELSQEELQRLLDASSAGPSRQIRSPFKDD
ncbi:MAG: hypothetical protein ACRENB_04990 [Gemmatimonadales bacterium]